MTHGPKPRDYRQRTPAKMRRLALCSALSARASENAVHSVTELDWETPRTKSAVELLTNIGLVGKVLVVIRQRHQVEERSFRNIPTVRIVDARYVTAYDVLWARDLLFCDGALPVTSQAGADHTRVEAKAS